jgi:hypothetical protein
MEAFASIVLLVIAMFVYAGFTAVTETLDEIIERLPPPRQPALICTGRSGDGS